MKSNQPIRIKMIIVTITTLLLLSIALSASAAVYTYDSLNRLESVTYKNGQKIVYTYDPGGNMLTVDSHDADTPPTVKSTEPTNGAIDVSVSASVYVTFSESVVEDVYFSDINIKNTIDSSVVESTYSLSGDLLTIVPFSNFNYSVTYAVYIPAGAVKDTGGNSLANTYSFSFTTLAAQDTVPPEFASTYPKAVNADYDSFDLLIQTNEDGKAYYVLLDCGVPAPTSAEVKAGTASGGGAAPQTGSIDLTANSESTATISGLAAYTDYDIYVVAEDIVYNLQETPVLINIWGAATQFEQGSQHDQGTYDLTAEQPTAFNWTRNSRFSAFNSNPLIKWQYDAPGSSMRYFRSSPAIGADGTIYIGNYNGLIYAFNQDGSIKWTYDTQQPIIYSSPVLGEDGTIYIGNQNGTHALNSDGTLKWIVPIYATGIALSSNGTLCVLTNTGKLVSVDSVTGDVYWSTNGTKYSYSCPAIASDGTIYFTTHYPSGSFATYLFAYNPDGTEKWRWQFPSLSKGYSGYGSPAISQDGNTIYIGSDDYNLYAINKNGTVSWSYTTGGKITGAPVVGEDGTIYFGSCDKSFYALNPDGSLKWKFSPGRSYIATTPIIDKYGNIIFYANINMLYSLNSEGAVNWSLSLYGLDINSSPAIGSDGTIYIGARYSLYAINSD